MTSQELSELKPGDTVYLGQLPVKFKSIKNTVILHFEPCETSGLLKGFEHVSQFSIRPMLHQPKYDPNRKFHKGDKARPRIINGRENPKVPLNVIFTVIGNEDEYGAVAVEYMSPSKGLRTSTTVHAVWLELVAPVEEMEPYYVGKAEINNTYGEYDTWAVFDKHGYIVAQFADEAYKPGEAKARAEQECDSRNAEHREEQE